MAEKLGDDAKTVGFQTVNCIVVFDKRSFKELVPHAIDLAKTLTNQAEEFVVSTFLGTALDNHRWKFVLQSRGQVDAQQLVGTFFEASRRHDGEVDGSAQVDQIGVGLILDLDLFVGFLVFIFAAADVRIVFIILVTAVSLAENLSPKLLIGLLVRFPVGVKFEDIKAILNLDLVVQSSVVCNLILFFDKIQLFLDRRIILVAVLSDLEQDFDHVLGSLVDVGFVQDAAELIVDSHGDLRIELFDVLANLSHQTHGNLDAVVSRLV